MTESERDSKYIKELEETIERQNSIIAELQEKLDPTPVIIDNGLRIDTSPLTTGKISFGANTAIGYHAAGGIFNYTPPAIATQQFVQDFLEEEKKKIIEIVEEMIDKLKDQENE
jgi:hypothetical protein